MALLEYILLGLGSIKLLFLVQAMIESLIQHCLRSKLDLAKRYGGIGTWALVTGASDGIGKEFCLKLAQDGFNVCLVARNQDKMQDVVREINTRFEGRKTRVISADLGAKAEY